MFTGMKRQCEGLILASVSCYTSYTVAESECLADLPQCTDLLAIYNVNDSIIIIILPDVIFHFVSCVYLWRDMPQTLLITSEKLKITAAPTVQCW